MKSVFRLSGKYVNLHFSVICSMALSSIHIPLKKKTITQESEETWGTIEDGFGFLWWLYYESVHLYGILWETFVSKEGEVRSKSYPRQLLLLPFPDFCIFWNIPQCPQDGSMRGSPLCSVKRVQKGSFSEHWRQNVYSTWICLTLSILI